MFTKVNSMGLFGMDTYMVCVEADLSNGLPRFDIVGLPDASVSESRERVRSAMKNCGYEFPVSRITINLAPADTRKEGPIYDLPIFFALLEASRQISASFQDISFIGELSLDGSLRKVNGALPMVIEARDKGMKEVFVPSANAAETSVVKGINVYAVNHVSEVAAHLTGKKKLLPVFSDAYGESVDYTPEPDFRDVKGQFEAKRAMEIAAAGGHNIIMLGSPGSGKSMLAKRLPSILPEMSFEEALETTKIYSISGNIPDGVSLIKKRPFRSPHHSVSSAGLSGGGTVPKPGEISLAHNGVLFLDELPEFSRGAMEIMRQPIEDGKITISRVQGTVSYPCSVMLVCAMNPCPCGYYGHPTRACTCPNGAVQRYLSKVSGPLLDRVDIHIEVPPVDFAHLSGEERGESSAAIRERVAKARQIQYKRFAGTPISCNAKMTPAMTAEYCKISQEATDLLERAFEKMALSARAYDKILKVSRTIADLDDSETVEIRHVAEAIQYRSLDRKFWK